MDGVHDMGGMHGFGKVEPEQDEPVFHDDWEARTFALCWAMRYTGFWCIDQGRFAREQLPPDVYLASSYYKKWELGLEKQLAELGLAGSDELAAGHALRPGKPLKRKLSAAEVPNVITRGSFARPPKSRRGFRPATVCAPKIFTRKRIRVCRAMLATRSAWSRRCAGCHVFPDTVAIGKGEDPQWLYTVLFDGRELWGESAEPSLKVSIEAFEPYLEPA
jgi:nitrile hydratase subunit beta